MADVQPGFLLGAMIELDYPARRWSFLEVQVGFGAGKGPQLHVRQDAIDVQSHLRRLEMHRPEIVCALLEQATSRTEPWPLLLSYPAEASGKVLQRFVVEAVKAIWGVDLDLYATTGDVPNRLRARAEHMGLNNHPATRGCQHGYSATPDAPKQHRIRVPGAGVLVVTTDAAGDRSRDSYHFEPAPDAAGEGYVIVEHELMAAIRRGRAWFDQALEEAAANAEPSPHITWLERGREALMVQPDSWVVLPAATADSAVKRSRAWFDLAIEMARTATQSIMPAAHLAILETGRDLLQALVAEEPAAPPTTPEPVGLINASIPSDVSLLRKGINAVALKAMTDAQFTKKLDLDALVEHFLVATTGHAGMPERPREPHPIQRYARLREAIQAAHLVVSNHPDDQMTAFLTALGRGPDITLNRGTTHPEHHRGEEPPPDLVAFAAELYQDLRQLADVAWSERRASDVAHHDAREARQDVKELREELAAKQEELDGADALLTACRAERDEALEMLQHLCALATLREGRDGDQGLQRPGIVGSIVMPPSYLDKMNRMLGPHRARIHAAATRQGTTAG